MPGVEQTVSYEVRLVLIVFTPLVVTLCYELGSFSSFQENFWFIFIFPAAGLIWLISCLAETNRTPFDFVEGESELVSGYNTEYRSGEFTLVILAEYTRILFISFLFSVFFWGEGGRGLFLFCISLF